MTRPLVGSQKRAGEPGDRRLARAGRADERDRLARRDVEVEIGEDRVLAVRELARGRSAPRHAGARSAIGLAGSGTRRLLVEHARELLEAGGRRLEQVVELAELLHGLEEAAQVEEERGQHAHAHVPVDDEPAAVEQHDRRREPSDELHARPVRSREALRPRFASR